MTIYTLTTSCTCEVYVDDNESESAPSDECFGCYEDDKRNLIEALDNWIEALELSHIEIQVSDAGWTRASYSGTIDADSEELLASLRINGDYNLEIDLPEGDDLAEFDFKAKRYSHDEPTGATFHISGLTTCDNPDCDGECNYNFCANLPD